MSSAALLLAALTSTASADVVVAPAEAKTTVVAEPATKARTPNARRYVVAIGFNESDNPAQKRLRFADDDAARFYEMLSSAAIRSFLLTRFDTDSQEVFRDLVPVARAPTRQVLKDVMRRIRESVEEDRRAGHATELYVYYAGHGDETDGVGYLTMADGRLTRPEFQSVVLDAPRADHVHLVIDACKSYFMVAGRGPGGRREPRKLGFGGPKPIDGVGYVLSTSSDAETHEWARVSGGIFSHEVRSALLGGADVDRDGLVDYEELAAFVAVANASIPSPGFRPRVFVRGPPGDHEKGIFGPAIAEGMTKLSFDPERAGRMSIRDQRGLAYADFHKASGQPVVIALRRPLRYEVEWGMMRYSVESRSADEVQLSSLEPEELAVVASRGEAHRAFEHLFESPFDAGVMRGFTLGTRRMREDATTAQLERTSTLDVALVTTGVAGIVAGGILGALAFDARTDALTRPQAERDGHALRSNVLFVSSGAVLAIGVSATTWALFRLLDED